MAVGRQQASGRATPAQGRDGRLDFWRGLCLLDMLLIHLVYEGVQFGDWLGAAIGQYTRFSAGGFIFVAGISIGAIFLPRALRPATRHQTYLALGRRSLYLLVVHYAAAMSFLAIYPLRDFDGPYPHPLRWVVDVLLFREGNDLLLFYVMAVGLSPVMLELLRRKGGNWALAGASLLAFALGRWDPTLLALPIQRDFPLLQWQVLFVGGLLLGAALSRYDRLTTGSKVLWTVAAWVGLAGVSVLAYGRQMGLPLPERMPIVFSKSPLSLGEVLRYLTLILPLVLTSDLLWRWLGGTRFAAFASRLGRRSLAVYVAHIWIVALLVSISWRTPWLGSWQGLLAVAGVGMMWLWAWTLERCSARRAQFAMWWRQWWTMPGLRTAASAVAAVSLMLGVHRALPELPASLPLPPIMMESVADAGDDGDVDVDDGPDMDEPAETLPT